MVFFSIVQHQRLMGLNVQILCIHRTYYVNVQVLETEHSQPFELSYGLWIHLLQIYDLLVYVKRKTSKWSKWLILKWAVVWSLCLKAVNFAHSSHNIVNCRAVWFLFSLIFHFYCTISHFIIQVSSSVCNILLHIM